MAFLVCLRLSCGSEILETESRVYKDTGREGNGSGLVPAGEKPHGLGVGISLERTGYGFWLLGKYDFVSFLFSQHIRHLLLFQFTTLQKRLGQHFENANAKIKDIELIRSILTSVRLDGTKTLTDLKKHNPLQRARVLYRWGYVWRVLVTSFHLEVLKVGGPQEELLISRYQALPPESRTLGGEALHRLFRTKRAPDNHPSVSWTLFDKFFLVKQTKGRSVEKDIVNLWDFNDGVKRIRWENKEYSVFFQKVISFVTEFHGAIHISDFNKGFYCYFLSRTHIWPAITSQKWRTYNAKHRRRWFGIQAGDNRLRWYLGKRREDGQMQSFLCRDNRDSFTQVQDGDRLPCLIDPLAGYNSWDDDRLILKIAETGLASSKEDHNIVGELVTAVKNMCNAGREIF